MRRDFGVHGEEEFVVFAVGEGLTPRATRRAGEEGGVEFEAKAGGVGESSGVAAEAVGEVHHGMEEWSRGAKGVAEEGGIVEARLEAEMAKVAHAVAETSGDPDAIAGTSGGAEDWPRFVWGGEDGGGEDEGGRKRSRRRSRGGDIAAHEGRVPMLGPCVHGIEEFVGRVLGKVGREAGGGEGAEGRAAHGGDVGDGAGDGFSGDEVEHRAFVGEVDGLEVTAFDEVVGGEQELVGVWSSHDGAIIAWPDEDVGETNPEILGPKCNVGKQFGFSHREEGYSARESGGAMTLRD